MNPNRGKRIVIFTETFLPRVDGIVNTLRWILNGVVAAGWEPMVVAPAGNTQEFPGAIVIGSPSIPFPLYPEVRLGYPSPGIVRQLDAFEPDLVHLAGPVTNGLGGLRYAHTRGLPVVSTYHTALPEYGRLYGLEWIVEPAWKALSAIHNGCAVTLCPSRATLHELRNRGFERLELWSRGVDASLFTPRRRSSAWRARLGIQDREVVVLCVSRLAREKKIDRLALALRMVEGVRLVLVGDGPERDRLQQLCSGLGVTFTGALHGAELATAYASSDVFGFPSDTETFGNVALEAMASGLPVVATTVGGQVDIVRHEQTGLLFEPENIDLLAAHLSHYRDDVALRMQHGAAGLKIAQSRSWPRQIEQLLGHYAAAQSTADRVASDRRAVAA